MLRVRKTFVALAATAMLPVATAAIAADRPSMQDFVTVQSQQSTTNYADRYTIVHGKVTKFELAPAAASVASVDRGGVLHMASSRAPGNRAAEPWSPPATPPASTGGSG
jgi:hypothetical protein